MGPLKFLILLGILFNGFVLQAEVLLNIPSVKGPFDSIYGRDEREFITKKSDKKILELSKSIGLIIAKEQVVVGKFRASIEAPLLQEEMSMCKGEPFLTSPIIPACTGFLVAPNIMATAGHCFQTEDDCLNKRIIFDVDATKISSNGYKISSKNVFSCSKIIVTRYDPNRPDLEDYSLIELDREPKCRLPLKLNLTKKIGDKEAVFMIGHPFGMPLILSPVGTVSENVNEFQFTTNLDAFEGNSGAPVFNKNTFEVEGILVNGQQDLVQDSKNKCYRNAIYNGRGLEGVLRAIELAPFLK